MTKIDSSSGNGKGAKVGDSNRLYTETVSKSEAQQAIDDGNGYNINTGQISLSATSAVLYVKNNEDKVLYIESIAVGIGTGSFSDNVEIFVVRNPTAGTIVSGASVVDMNINRNFGSSNTLSADAYKGASGNTFTDGDDGVLIAQNGQGRMFANINLELKKGNSIGIRVNPNLSSGNCECYAALICHLETET